MTECSVDALRGNLHCPFCGVNIEHAAGDYWSHPGEPSTDSDSCPLKKYQFHYKQWLMRPCDVRFAHSVTAVNATSKEIPAGAAVYLTSEVTFTERQVRAIVDMMRDDS